MILYKYIVPGQGLTTPWGLTFYVNRNIFVTLVICCKFQKISFKDDFIQIFHNFIHVYSPGVGADNPQGTKF